MAEPLLSRTAVDMSAAIRARRLTAEALMETTLARIAQTNPHVNAIVSLRDADALRAAARAADAGDVTGPLHGLPIAIKDLADAKGLPTSQGSPVFAGQIAEQDSPHVARLRAAGAIIIGKTNTPEFGLGSHSYNPVHGRTRNPYDLSRSCGGSSGGAAVALACGMIPIADGSDMMGSLRNPAGWNNVYGLRPTQGTIPEAQRGDAPWDKLATNGPMARSPEDLKLLLDVMTGQGPEALEHRRSGARIAWLGDWGGALPYEDGLLELCEAALAGFEDCGCIITPLDAPFSREALWHSWTTLRSRSVAQGLAELYDAPETRARLKPEALWEIERGLAMTPEELERAAQTRRDWLAHTDALFARYDALAMPTAQVWPFDVAETWPRQINGTEMDAYHRWMECVIPVSLIGLPAVAVPAGFGANGLPAGLQLAGARGRDTSLLAMAQAYHRATDWPRRAPPLLG